MSSLMADPALGTWGLVALGATVGVMGSALVSDIRYGLIPNKLTYPAVLVGVGLGFLTGGTAGMWSAFAGFGLGFGLLFLGMMFGGIGGGDVKLAGALGALVGLPVAALGLLYMCLCSGAMAFAILIWKGKLFASLRRIGRFMFTSLLPFLETEELKEEDSDPFPLGVAIVAGFAWALIETHYGAAPLLELSL
jgi:prepilin peptidase CpaA